jgi:hypothetical protein
MTRLPQPGGDEGNWGSVLNDYLLAAHDASGILRADSIQEAQLAPEVRTKLNGLAGPVGPPGPNGATGPTGATGPAGTTDWNGITNKPTIPTIIASVTAPSTPAVGDMWVDLSA